MTVQASLVFDQPGRRAILDDLAQKRNELIRIVQSMDEEQLARLRAVINGEYVAGTPKRALDEEAMDPMGAS